MVFDYNLSIYLFFLSCLMFSYFYKHLLLTMISLEFMAIFLVMNMYNMFILVEINIFLIILFLTIVVCEGALSLTLVVLLVRFYGNDYVNSMMILKW